MKKLIIMFLTCISLYSCAQIGECKDYLECGFFLEPLIGCNICLKQNKDDVLDKFDKSTLYDNNFDKVNKYYEVSKNITLPNNENTSFYGILAFNKNNELVYFNLSLIYGKDYSYWEELVLVLKNADTYKTNNFIYESKKVICNEKTTNCYKTFNLRRNSNTVEYFESNFKCTLSDILEKR